ncbi:hypothetical protein [Eisenibacter elegans]|uniref:hypothetical protein n=1 Tax=Eisenibacter elegans TaxID=997 RepID=UPI00041E74D9|nr:hypothetical protein [Eisenibacter elegans]
MATPSLRLVDALRKTAKTLEEGAPYQWGHMGSCNCGNLAQEITRKSKGEIHALALQTRMGDWADQVSEFCPVSNLPMDLVIGEMIEAGFSTTDLKNLERLSDTEILRRLPTEKRYLIHNKRDDVVLYMRAWADMLEEQLLAQVPVETAALFEAANAVEV